MISWNRNENFSIFLELIFFELWEIKIHVQVEKQLFPDQIDLLYNKSMKSSC